MLTVWLEGIDTETIDATLGSVSNRIRCTDEVGWCERHRLAVLLPDTDAVGARKCAADLDAILERHLVKGRWQVLVYPDDWYPAITNGELGHDRVKQNGHAAVPRNRAGDGAGRRVTSDSNPGIDGAIQRYVPTEAAGGLLETRLPRWKRLADIVVATIALILVSPLLLAAATAVRTSSPGPVIFRQRRTGVGGRNFDFFKFRTMHVDAETRKHELMSLNEQSGPVFKIRRDPRITPIGRILRKTSIDELPQLWNVLKGDMTLVGPRPPTPDEVVRYEAWQRRRLDAIGGLTCIWQVSGRSEIQFQDWVRMDIRYVEGRSFLNDAWILLRTIPAVLLCRGAR